MTKSDLIDVMAEKAEISKVDSKKALDAFIECIGHCLKNEDRISLVGFGSFSVSKRPARDGRNPQTGQTIKIPAKNVVKFKPGTELSNKIN